MGYPYSCSTKTEHRHFVTNRIGISGKAAPPCADVLFSPLMIHNETRTIQSESMINMVSVTIKYGNCSKANVF